MTKTPMDIYKSVISEQVRKEQIVISESNKAESKASKAYASHEKMANKGHDDLKMSGTNGYFHKHNDMADRSYIIKHASGRHSMTNIDHTKHKNEADYESQSRKDNPHLSDSEHKEVAKAIHKNY